jgi:uncharacterized protein (DUF2235 family)
MTMPKKNIVLCFDGTGNSFNDLEHDSNVAKLYSTLKLDEKQVAYYHPGVGTMGDPTRHSRIAREWSQIKGLAFGSGLLDNVADAYRYLMDNYVDGDHVFLFGFSRGAFTARVLASVIHVYGLLCEGNHGAIPYILTMFSENSRKAQKKQHTFDADDAFKWQFSHTNDVRIRFCGVWDTVASYGWIYDPIELPFLGNNPIIEVGRHAVSIHERRCMFQDNLWGPAQAHQDIKQVWFAGVHSDIGGSYEEAWAGLSKLPLEWMMVEAVAAGLIVDHNRAEVVLGRRRTKVRNLPDYVTPDRDATKHESLDGAWWLLEYLPQHDPHEGKRGLIWPKGRYRAIPEGSVLHQSVVEGPYAPASLPSGFTIERLISYGFSVEP